MKSILLQASSPILLNKELNEFLTAEATSDEIRKRLRNDPDLTASQLECQEIINVQQYITQVIEQNKFDPRAGQQTITYYLLIIYR